jgi:hypothetical protein
VNIERGIELYGIFKASLIWNGFPLSGSLRVYSYIYGIDYQIIIFWNGIGNYSIDPMNIRNRILNKV